MEVKNYLNLSSLNINKFSAKQGKSFAGSMRVSKTETNQLAEAKLKAALTSATDKISLSGKFSKDVPVTADQVSYSKKGLVKADVPVIDPSDNISSVAEEEVVSAKKVGNPGNVSNVKVEEWQKKIRDLAINHLRSKVGQSSDNARLADTDASGVISFKDISDLVKQMDEGDYDQAISIAFEGVRSRVGKTTSEDPNNASFDLTGDGVVSFADLANLRDLVGKK